MAEAEFYAVVKGASTGISIVALYADLGFALKLVIESDSSSARAMCARSGVGRVKHMATRYMWIQEQLRDGVFTLISVPTADNVSDPFTKPLTRKECEKHYRTIGFVW